MRPIKLRDRSGGLLLGYAVNSSTAPKQILECDRYDFSIGVGATQRFEHGGILGDSIGRRNDGAVGKIQVYIGADRNPPSSPSGTAERGASAMGNILNLRPRASVSISSTLRVSAMISYLGSSESATTSHRTVAALTYAT